MNPKNPKQKRYSPEFKEESVARCERIGSTQASQDLGIPIGTLSRWKHEAAKNTRKEDSGKPKLSYEDLEKENRKLKKELGYVTEINRVLKKSTAIFSSSELGGLK